AQPGEPCAAGLRSGHMGYGLYRRNTPCFIASPIVPPAMRSSSSRVSSRDGSLTSVALPNMVMTFAPSMRTQPRPECSPCRRTWRGREVRQPQIQNGTQFCIGSHPDAFVDAANSLRACTLQDATTATISIGGSGLIAHRAHDIAARDVNLSNNDCPLAVHS